MDLSGWIRRQCLVLGLSGVIIYVWRYSGVKFWRCQLSAAMSRGQWFLVKASQKKGRLESCVWRRQQSSKEDVMSGRVGGAGRGWGFKSSCMSYSDKAASEDHAVAATLVLLFAFRLWWRWTFLLLEFPAEWQTERKSHQTLENKRTTHFVLQHCNRRLITRTGGRNGRKVWRCCALWETQRCPSPDDSNQFVESLVHVHSDFGWSLHVRDLQLSGELLALFLGYLRTERIMTHCNHNGH